MEIWVLSSVAVYHGTSEIYFGSSIHASERKAYDAMICNILEDLSEKLAEEDDPPKNEAELWEWIMYCDDRDIYLRDTEAVIYIDNTDFMYRIEKYTINWEVSA